MSTTIDTKITELFGVLSKKKEEVELAEAVTKQPWKTNCSFQVQGMSTPINIQTVTEANLINLLADILQRKEYFAQSYKILGISQKDTKIGGFDYDDWVLDFKKRIAIISIKEQKQQLSQLEERLNAIVSPEQRRELELQAIMSSLDVK